MKIEDVELVNMSYSLMQKRTKFEFSCYGNITPSLEELKGKKLNLELKKRQAKQGYKCVSLVFAR